MSEEEKKAIEDIKRTIELYELKPIDRISVEFDEFDYKIFKTILNLIEKQQNRIDELEKALVDGDFKYRNKINKAIDKLKKHKHDLDYEPWSIYKVNGSILFDLVKILEE